MPSQKPKFGIPSCKEQWVSSTSMTIPPVVPSSPVVLSPVVPSSPVVLSPVVLSPVDVESVVVDPLEVELVPVVLVESSLVPLELSTGALVEGSALVEVGVAAVVGAGPSVTGAGSSVVESLPTVGSPAVAGSVVAVGSGHPATAKVDNNNSETLG
ncbi:hypothetical protein [Nannocystis pusilla]|uniref:hypothetical protein n=1 Tax=Nannocystis pusilla TaxID=889268 RepID=UPI003B7FC34C